MKNLFFKSNHDLLVSKIQKAMPECQDENVRKLAMSYQSYLRSGICWSRLMRVCFLVLGLILLIAAVAGTLHISGLRLPEPIEKVAAFCFVGACGFGAQLVMRRESSKCFRSFIRNNNPKNLNLGVESSAPDAD